MRPMNYSKVRFSPTEFMTLPVFETKQEAPVKTPFILGAKSKMGNQKEFLSKLEKDLIQASEEVKEHYKKLGVVKVHYYEKHVDGNISDRGGYIKMEDLLRPVPLVTGKITLGDDSDSGLTFKAGA